MTERYLEDFAVGQTFGSGRLRVEKERIKTFAALAAARAARGLAARRERNTRSAAFEVASGAGVDQGKGDDQESERRAGASLRGQSRRAAPPRIEKNPAALSVDQGVPGENFLGTWVVHRPAGPVSRGSFRASRQDFWRRHGRSPFSVTCWPVIWANFLSCPIARVAASMFARRAVLSTFVPAGFLSRGSSSCSLPSAQLHETGTPDSFSFSRRCISMRARASITSAVADSAFI